MRRNMTVTVIMLGLLIVLSGVLVAHAPSASLETSAVEMSSEWQITDTRAIEVEGEPLALSPDGQWLAGLDQDGGRICVWDVQTLTPTCADKLVHLVHISMAPPIVWAPDSSAVVFAEGDVLGGGSTDVMIFDVASGRLTALTHSEESYPRSAFLGPAWTSDSQRVVFAYSEDEAESVNQTSVVSGIRWIDRTSGETGDVPLEDWNPSDYFVTWNLLVSTDDTITFEVQRVDEDEKEAPDEVEGVWQVRLDGSGLTQLVAASKFPQNESPVPVGVSADGRHVSVASGDWNPVFFLVDARSREVRYVELNGRRLEVNGSRNVSGPPVFSPGGRYALVHSGEGSKTSLFVMDLETGLSEPVLDGGTGAQVAWSLDAPTWANNNTVFIPSPEDARSIFGINKGVLLTLKNTPSES